MRPPQPLAAALAPHLDDPIWGAERDSVPCMGHSGNSCRSIFHAVAESRFDFKDEDLYAIRDDPLVSKLEGDPRYQAFLKKLNFQTKEQTPMNRDHGLLPLILIYGAASLVHFLHNAVYLGSYPNMPVWLTPLGVLASWLVVAATGAIGYWLLRRGSTAMGLAVTGLYAILGFDSLDHYAVAPVSAHSLAMNATIVIELITAAALLVATARVAFRRTATSSI